MTYPMLVHSGEKAMAPRSSVLAWRIPGTVEPGGLPSMGSHRVGHNWSDLAAAAAAVHSDCYNKNTIRLAGFSNRNVLFSRITVLEAGKSKIKGLAGLVSDLQVSSPLHGRTWSEKASFLMTLLERTLIPPWGHHSHGPKTKKINPSPHLSSQSHLQMPSFGEDANI